MEIVLATKEHLNQIMEIEKECFIEPFKEESLIYELMENAFSVFYVAIIENKVVGFIDFWITFDSSTICQIAVSEDYRNKGIASKLLEKMFIDLKDKEVVVSSLEVRTHNIEAINLYLKHGYFKEIVKPHYYNNGDDALYMLKGVE